MNAARVTLLAGDRSHEVALADAVPLVRLLPVLARELSLDAGPRGLALMTATGRALAPGAGLAEQDVRDGDVLVLATPSEPPDRCDDPVRALAAAVDAHATPRPDAVPPTASAVAGELGGLAGAALLVLAALAPGRAGSAPAAGVDALVALVALLLSVASVVAGDERRGGVRLASGCLLAACAGGAAAGASGAGLGLLAVPAAGLLAASLLDRRLPPWWAAPVLPALGLLGVVGVCGHVDPGAALVALACLAALAAPALPLVLLRLSGLHPARAGGRRVLTPVHLRHRVALAAAAELAWAAGTAALLALLVLLLTTGPAAGAAGGGAGGVAPLALLLCLGPVGARVCGGASGPVARAWLAVGVLLTVSAAVGVAAWPPTARVVLGAAAALALAARTLAGMAGDRDGEAVGGTAGGVAAPSRAVLAPLAALVVPALLVVLVGGADPVLGRVRETAAPVLDPVARTLQGLVRPGETP